MTKRIVANLFLFLLACSFAHAQEKLLSGENWKDNNGNMINAHGAGILVFKNTYYLFGEIKKGKTHLVPGQSWEDYRVDAGGISCYASKDLMHWNYEGIALAPNKTDSSSDIHISKVVERPKVIYNARTNKFVMWIHIDKEDYSYAHVGVAISDNPGGPYKYLKSTRPNEQQSRDMTVFKDDNGKAYLIYSSENNNTMQICELSNDYLTPTKNYIRIFENQRREAPAMFRHNGKYYLITSLCSGWDPNPARYAVADSVMGNWQQQGNPCVGNDSATTFNSQSTYVLPVKNENGKFIFMADRWNKTDLENSTYLWLPLTVKDGKIEIKNTHGK
jgi:beta-xylosidase